ncbi:NADH-dependent flavin oxidoreductase [Planococcus sp. NCCP-2050]|uniref:NADH-dependent flavin oxidoreductase n=1 Tax=Planococcus sp. NCCP-2050 TaxID=2944679 RepID=UPI00204212A2|nr:NADH-dependent flavin oxidoreductase [Planococcus sp. NCCP-2050]GKW47317.1 putative NADH-dependent flavin oxidoreductase YqiG [Planococcus sp. NCCP-2050]
MKPEFNALFEEIKLPNGVVLNNRLGVAPMTTYSGNPDGTVSDEELLYYRRRSNIGSLFITACIAVSENGIAFPGQFIAFKEDLIMPRLKQLAAEMKTNGNKAILQMQHGGRQGQPELIEANETVAPSSVGGTPEKAAPRELTAEEITNIIRDFGETTRRAIEAGFDGVEIHGANTYLLQQFVSEATNRREDEWGGSFENRLKFPLAVLAEVKRVGAEFANEEFIVGYRLSPEEYSDLGVGYTIEETKVLTEKLIEGGIHYLHVSLMDYKKRPHNEAIEGTIVEILSKQIAGRAAFVVVGNVRKPEDAVAALKEGADIVVMGRQALVDPEWTEKVKQGKEDEIFHSVPKERNGKLDIPGPLWQLMSMYKMVEIEEEVNV